MEMNPFLETSLQLGDKVESSGCQLNQTTFAMGAENLHFNIATKLEEIPEHLFL